MEAIHLIPQFEVQLLRLNYSSKSISNYLSAVSIFLKHNKHVDLNELSINDITTFVQEQVRQRNIGISYQRIFMVAICKFYRLVLKKPLEKTKLPVKKTQGQTNLLSRHDISLLLNNAKSIKQKSMIGLIYDTGIKTGELVNLKRTDLNLNTGKLLLTKKRDTQNRTLLLSTYTVNALHEYLKIFNPQKYVFESREDKPYTARSIEETLKKVALEAGIKKKTSPNILRLSCAHHLIESGLDIKELQKRLGHYSLKTTIDYVRTFPIRKTDRPLDMLTG